MNRRATGILLLVAAALGAFVWFYEIEGEEGRKQASEAEKRLFVGLEPEDVSWVELTTSDGTRVRAERDASGWQIRQPLAFPGDAGAWDGIAAALTQSTRDAIFEDPQAPEVYGLGDGADEVRFGTPDGEHALRLGSAAPLGGNTYAAVAGARPVYTIPTWRASSLRKDFDALREKRILRFDVGSVTGLVASWPGGRVELAREGEAWRVVSPIEGPADAEVVSDLLSNLSFLRAQGFEDAPAADAETGLAPPAYRVALTITDDTGEAASQRVLTLEVGSVVDEGARFARAGLPSLFRIAEARLGDLPRDVSAYRFKQLAHFAVEDAARVEMIFRDGSDTPLEIDAVRDGSVWSSQPESMDPEKIAGLVSELSGLSADAILAERVGPEELAGLGLAPPRVSLTVRGAEGDAVLAQVRLGARQGADGVVAQTGENPQVFRLDAATAEHLPVSLEAFRNRFLARGEADRGETDLDSGGEGADPESGVDDAALESILESP